jgi:hypothetical protein
VVPHFTRYRPSKPSSASCGRSMSSNVKSSTYICGTDNTTVTLISMMHIRSVTYILRTSPHIHHHQRQCLSCHSPPYT